MVVLVSGWKQRGNVTALRTLRENIVKSMLVSKELPPIFRLIMKVMLESATLVSVMVWYGQKVVSKVD